MRTTLSKIRSKLRAAWQRFRKTVQDVIIAPKPITTYIANATIIPIATYACLMMSLLLAIFGSPIGAIFYLVTAMAILRYGVATQKIVWNWVLHSLSLDNIMSTTLPTSEMPPVAAAGVGKHAASTTA